MKVLCVIPARYASTRLPGKPLSLIAGKPMIQHVYERACQAKLPDEVVVATDNELVKKAVDGFGGKAMMTSPDHPSGTDRLAEKVVTDLNGYALYFSRSLMPYPRNKPEGYKVYKHVGIYAYRRSFLLKYAALQPTPLERAESLEQLRALENGYKIKVLESDFQGIGVDTPEDLAAVNELFAKMNK